MSRNGTSSPGQGPALCPSGRTRLSFAKRSAVAVLAVTGLLVTAACSSSHSTPAAARSGNDTPASGSGQGSASSPAAQPGIVAATTSGALVVLDPSTGAVTRTLVSSGVAVGAQFGEDEIAVSPDGGTIYFTGRTNCTDQIESEPASGGTPAVVTTGELPAISPSGTDLAFTRQDEGDCNGSWLLYIAGTPSYTTADGTTAATGALYVSEEGARPTQIATGILAAAWL
jgi:hypothetical protein